MKTKVKKCNHCGRHSECYADGLSCPWCGRRAEAKGRLDLIVIIGFTVIIGIFIGATLL